LRAPVAVRFLPPKGRSRGHTDPSSLPGIHRDAFPRVVALMRQVFRFGGRATRAELAAQFGGATLRRSGAGDRLGLVYDDEPGWRFEVSRRD